MTVPAQPPLSHKSACIGISLVSAWRLHHLRFHFRLCYGWCHLKFKKWVSVLPVHSKVYIFLKLQKLSWVIKGNNCHKKTVTETVFSIRVSVCCVYIYFSPFDRNKWQVEQGIVGNIKTTEILLQLFQKKRSLRFNWYVTLTLIPFTRNLHEPSWLIFPNLVGSSTRIVVSKSLTSTPSSACLFFLPALNFSAGSVMCSSELQSCKQRQ